MTAATLKQQVSVSRSVCLSLSVFCLSLSVSREAITPHPLMTVVDVAVVTVTIYVCLILRQTVG